MSTLLTVALIFLLLLGVAVVRARRAVSTRSRLTIGWADAWLKTLVVVVGIPLFVVLIPAEALKLEMFRDLDRVGQDLLGVCVWSVGLVISLGALTWAQRREHL